MSELTQDEGRLEKLNSLYNDSESVDKDLFSEQRSNWLLYIGHHFNRHAGNLQKFARSMGHSNESRKGLRIVKNHLGSICDKLAAHVVLNHNPDVYIEAKDKAEVQDRKAADIANSVWAHIKKENKINEIKDDFANDFVVGGELAAYVGWNPSMGNSLGIEAEINQETGEIISTKPKYSGEVEIKRIETFNLLRDPAGKTWDKCRWVIHREMIDKKDLVASFEHVRDIYNQLEDDSQEDFMVFDGYRGTYSKTGREKVLVKKIFYRPCSKYPEGYFIFFTSVAIIAEGSLHGKFPIVYRAFQKVNTNPRGYSVIRRLRAPQIEINRIASYISESQINFRDKLLISSGTKLSHGGTANGVAGIKYSGKEPIPLNGQSGEKYLSTLDHAISELYKLSHVREEEEDKVPTSDANSLLFASLKDKKKFSAKSDIFEAFLRELCEASVECAKTYYTEENLIPMLDQRDRVNIAEFKNIDKLSYSLSVKSLSEDIQSMLGTQISVQHVLQYSQNLPENITAQLIASMPFLKDSNLAEEITADIRAVDDVFASLERGEYIPAIPEDNHQLFIKKIANKIKTSAYRYLEPQIQQLYMQRYQQHKQFSAQLAQQKLMEGMGMIPAGGALVTISGIKDAEGNALRIPVDAIMHTVERLNTQGSLQNQMRELPEAAQADMVEMTRYNQEQMQNNGNGNTPLSPTTGFGGI
jgi:hypothetical protein